jgi:hypothetical protein
MNDSGVPPFGVQVSLDGIYCPATSLCHRGHWFRWMDEKFLDVHRLEFNILNVQQPPAMTLTAR